MRNNEEMKRWAAMAERKGEPQCGVKGKCLLGEHLESPECIPIDYMHSVLEGVFKQLMKLWFDPKFHSEQYNLIRSMQVNVPRHRLTCMLKTYFASESLTCNY